MTSPAVLTFGSLPLLSPNPPWADYAIEATAEGTTWGNPAAVVATVASMLMDGERAKITQFGNREATVPLQIRGATLNAVAAGEAELMAEVNEGRNTLTWSPPGWSTPSVFDVVYAVLDFKYDDLAEKNQVTRYFTLTLYCLPFARREEPTSVVAVPIVPGTVTITSINACTSLTGWSTSASGAVVSGAIVVQRVNAKPAVGTAIATLTSAYAVAAGEYVAWELKLPAGRMPDFSFNGGIAGTVVATEAVGSAGTVRYYVAPPGVGTFSVTSSRVFVLGLALGETLAIYDLSKYSRLPMIGAGYQRSFAASVGGTARTTADITLDCASGNIGRECIVFTAPPDVLSPPLRTWRTAGTAATLNAGAVSGALNTFAAPSVYTIPANLVKPGTYALVGRLIGSGTSTFTWTAKTLAAYASSGTDDTGSTDVALSGTYTAYSLGVMDLPTVDQDPTSPANVEITLASSVTTATIDELWLFNLDDGVLTWVAGMSTPGTKVEVRSATIDRDRPGWLLGTSGTDADNTSVAERCVSAGVHQFPPGDLAIYVVTQGSTDTTVTVEFYERYQHHVPPEAS